MIKFSLNFFYVFILICCFSCDRKNNRNSSLSGYSKNSECLIIKKGKVLYDTLQTNDRTYKIENGSNQIYILKREGNTFIDSNEDWEAKYFESLIFQIDSNNNKLKYCDSNLMKIECKYFWICYAKELKKVIKDINKGCIIFSENKDSIDINVQVDFGFGGIFEKDDSRELKFMGPLEKLKRD